MKNFFLDLLFTLYVLATVISLIASIIIFADFNNILQLRDILYISIPLFFILAVAMPKVIDNISNWYG